jgi:MFS family permease
VRATGRLAGAQIFVSASLPLNASVGAVAAKRLSGHEGWRHERRHRVPVQRALAVRRQQRGSEPRQAGAARGPEPLALGALVCGLAIWAGSYALFIVGTAIFGSGQGPSTLGRAAAADLYPPMLRGRGVGTVTTAGAIGAVVGPLVAIAAGGGAVALGVVRSAGPFLVVPVLGFVAVWLIARMYPDPRSVAADLGHWYRNLPPIPEPPPPRDRAELLRLGPARAAVTATALAQAAMVGVMAITSVELGDHGWADWQVQLLMAAHFVGMFALAYPVGLLADRIGRRRTSLLGLAACGVGAFGTALTGASPLITPFFFLIGLGWAGCFVAGTSILADITSARERGVLTASNDLIVAMCAALASISAGVLLSGLGYWAVGVVFGTLLVIALPGLLRLQEPTVGVYIEPPAQTSPAACLSDSLRRR